MSKAKTAKVSPRKSHNKIVSKLLQRHRVCAEAEKAANDQLRGKTVRLLDGPYKGRECLVESVTIGEFPAPYIFVHSIPSTIRPGKYVSYATRKDGRRGYLLSQVEFV